MTYYKIYYKYILDDCYYYTLYNKSYSTLKECQSVLKRIYDALFLDNFNQASEIDKFKIVKYDQKGTELETHLILLGVNDNSFIKFLELEE